MKLNAIVAGVGMTPFGKHMDTGLKALGAEAVKQALADAGIAQDELEAAWVGNAAEGGGIFAERILARIEEGNRRIKKLLMVAVH